MLDRNLLSISALTGQLKVGVVRQGTVLRSWESPLPAHDYAEYVGALKQAIPKTLSEARQAVLVLTHPQLSHTVVEMPPARGWTLARLLERQAQKLKAFTGEAVWSCQPALPLKKTEAVLLHLSPKFVLQPWIKAAQEMGLELVRVLPTASVLIGQLKALPLQKDEVALLAAETGDYTTIVIGRKDGRVCLSRMLLNNWNKAADKVAVDLVRSIGFAEQQSGLTVSSAWLFGAGAKERLPALQAALKLPVKLSPVEYSPFYWVEQAARLPEKADGNLISTEVRQAPKRQRFLTAASVLLGLLMLAALATAGVMEFLRKDNLRALAPVNKRISDLQVQQRQLRQSIADVIQLKEALRVVSDQPSPPVPDWFLGYLGKALPDDLVLTQLRVVRTNDWWSVYLAGTAQPATNAAPTAGVGAFNTFSNSLVTGPFHLALTRCELTQLAGSPSARAPLTAATLARWSAMDSADDEPKAFVLEGNMR